MSDQMCSGSGNAAKAFTRHTEQDRSLQQDRAGPASGPQVSQFRTAAPGQVEAHDAAFNQHLGGPQAMGNMPQFISHPMPQAMHNYMPQSDRAQIPHQMNAGPIIEPPSAHQSVVGNPQVPSWAAEFRDVEVRQPNLSLPGIMMQETRRFQAYHIPPHHVVGHMEPLMQAPNPVIDDEFEREMASWMSQNGPTEEEQITANMERIALESEFEGNGFATAAALDREFDILARELDAQHTPETEDLAVQPPTKESVQAPEEPIQTPEDKVNQEQDKNADELAAAAQRIVEVMESSKSNEKMRDSYFLHLMRQLADREVVLRDEEFVNTNGEKVEPMRAREASEQNTESASVTPASTKASTQDWEPIDLTISS